MKVNSKRIAPLFGLAALMLLALDIAGAQDVGNYVTAITTQPAHAICQVGGNLYSIDRTANVVRKTVIATGATTVLAGSGVAGMADGVGTAAQFTWSTSIQNATSCGICSDAAGANLFVTDVLRVRKIAIATGAVTTLAGSGIKGVGDGTGTAVNLAPMAGICADNAGNLYIAEIFTQEIRKIVIATGAVTTLCGQNSNPTYVDGVGTAAKFFNPSGICTDNAGNLYVAENKNCTIRKIVISTATVTTVAGQACGSTPTNPNTTTPGPETDGVGTAAVFYYPGNICMDNAGNLYTSGNSGGNLRKVASATRAATTYYSGKSGSLCFDSSNGSMYVGTSTGIVSISPGHVTTLAGSGTSGAANGTGTAAQLNQPRCIWPDTSGNLYVADWGSNTIRKVVVATGVVTTLSSNFSQPSGICGDGLGNLYVADNGLNQILKVVIATGATTVLAGSGTSGATDGVGPAAQFNDTQGICIDNAGNLYATDGGNNKIRKIVIATGAVTTLAGSGAAGAANGTGVAATFTNPLGICTDNTNLYVADNNSQQIRKIVISTGAVTTLAGSVGGSTDGIGAVVRFSGPGGICSDGKGNLFVIESGNNKVRKIVIATATVTTLAGAGGGNVNATFRTSKFNGAQGICVDSAGGLYVGDTGNHLIRMLAK